MLVAGATGYLGRHLVAYLNQHGYWVRALVRRSEQAEMLPDADEIVVGRVTEADTLSGIAFGMDTVFSTIGITRQRDGVNYDDVDYRGNLSLLREAERSGVTRFAYVSVLHGRELRATVALAAAKERFVDQLDASSLQTTVIRPTGYFSDMSEFLAMAQKGRVYLIGDGTKRMNPISGADLAHACVAAVVAGEHDIEVGGPEVLTHRQIAESAFAAVGRDPRITGVPLGVARALRHVAEIATPQRIYGPLQFFLAAMTADMVARPWGEDHLSDYFRAHSQPRE
ncbi:SDR family oxidoreductase [Nocardia sp. NRRL WC-3656]|uniref:SDR family oxidoreductase n=1 Tax=Nocardia sp. NRRL WC-3656 TaxID=1463824 RepID=UPI000559E403|nr:SDR family oxidoreductase [Nocardia sp. NRRL WC-3656]